MVLEAGSDAVAVRPIRVLLVDDEAVIRAGLRVLIDSWASSEVVGEADGAQEALAAIETLQPNVIVCSHTGRLNGFADVLRHLTKGAGEIPVVLLTGSRKRELYTMAVEAGAKWVVSTKDAAMELRSALEKVHSGERWLGQVVVPASSASARNRHRRNGTKGDTEQRLTNRERDVAALVSQGWTNKQVGKRLGITEVTVRHHLSSVFSKLRITNRFQLIAWLYRNGPVGPAEIA
jgi:DNA-binding NarL/FixJ family response regulator